MTDIYCTSPNHVSLRTFMWYIPTYLSMSSPVWNISCKAIKMAVFYDATTIELLSWRSYLWQHTHLPYLGIIVPTGSTHWGQQDPQRMKAAPDWHFFMALLVWQEVFIGYDKRPCIWTRLSFQWIVLLAFGFSNAKEVSLPMAPAYSGTGRILLVSMDKVWVWQAAVYGHDWAFQWDFC